MSHRIVTMEPAHVDGAVAAHAAAFPDRPNTAMGRPWLRYLYNYYLSSEGAICLTALADDGTVLGAVLGGEPSVGQGFRRSAMRKFLPRLLFKSVFNPVMRARAIRPIRERLSGANREDAPPKTPGRAGNLLSIGLIPQARGTGAGGDLMLEFQRRGRQQGFDYLYLYVAVDNARAVAFYEKHGWRRIHANKRMARYERPIEAEEK